MGTAAGALVRGRQDSKHHCPKLLSVARKERESCPCAQTAGPAGTGIPSLRGSAADTGPTALGAAGSPVSLLLAVGRSRLRKNVNVSLIISYIDYMSKEWYLSNSR